VMCDQLHETNQRKVAIQHLDLLPQLSYAVCMGWNEGVITHAMLEQKKKRQVVVC